MATRCNDPQLTDFIESEFLEEQVNATKHMFRIMEQNCAEPYFVLYSFCSTYDGILSWMKILDFLLKGGSHKQDLQICCPAEESGQGAWLVCRWTWFHLHVSCPKLPLVDIVELFACRGVALWSDAAWGRGLKEGRTVAAQGLRAWRKERSVKWSGWGIMGGMDQLRKPWV